MDITVLEGRDEWMLDVHKEMSKTNRSEDGGVDITLAFVLETARSVGRGRFSRKISLKKGTVVVN